LCGKNNGVSGHEAAQCVQEMYGSTATRDKLTINDGWQEKLPPECYYINPLIFQITQTP
jgi:hypothetical protein